jgi:cytochrome c
MKKEIIASGLAAVVGLSLSLGSATARADEFTQQDVERWTGQFMQVVAQGRALWTDGKLGTNGVACAQCHPNAANTHPETYPKFQAQLGRTVLLRDMINWCIENPVRGKRLEPDDAKMRAIEAYIYAQRKGTPLNYGKH